MAGQLAARLRRLEIGRRDRIDPEALVQARRHLEQAESGVEVLGACREMAAAYGISLEAFLEQVDRYERDHLDLGGDLKVS